MTDILQRNKYTILLILLLIAGGLAINSSINKPVEISYTQFQSIAATAKEIHLSHDGRVATFTLKDSAGKYQVVLPAEGEALIREAAADGTTVKIDRPRRQSGFMTTLIILTFPVLLLIAALVWLSRRHDSHDIASKNPARLVTPKDNHVALSDVVGNPGDFDEVEEVIDFLHNPKKYRQAGATLPKGVLLYGPPGVGKTMLAKAIANEAGVPFYSISGSEFIEMYVGVGAKRVRTMFKEIKKEGAAVLFVDEIDAIGSSRNAGPATGSSREHDQTLNQLLVEMDGMDETVNLIIIGATNRPDTLDKALLRPGRFDRMIPISLPDINARKRILEACLMKKAVDSCVDAAVVAKGTPGFSGADICNLVNEAAMCAAREERKVIKMADLELARDRIIMGKEKSSVMDDEEILITAYHEAGHAIVGYLQEKHDPVHKISVVPRGLALGVTTYLPEKDKYSASKIELVGHITSLMGGRAAEELRFGKKYVTTGASNDIERATSIARKMVTKWGMSPFGIVDMAASDASTLVYSDITKAEIDKYIKDIIQDCYQDALQCLEKNEEKLHQLATLLVEKETIDRDEFEEVMNNDVRIQQSVTHLRV